MALMLARFEQPLSVYQQDKYDILSALRAKCDRAFNAALERKP